MISRGRSYSGRERHCAFLNTSGGAADGASRGPVARFADISATSGIDVRDDGRALVTVDWDHDGDLDVWISNRTAPRLRFFRNDVPSDNHHLALRLQGAAGGGNRDAIGARVEVVPAGDSTGAAPLLKTLRAGDSFLSQSTKWLHFGLGAAEAVESVRVRWPDGEWESFNGLEVDRRYRLVQGSGQAESLDARGPGPAIAPGPAILPEAQSTARIPLATLLPMVDLSYEPLDGDPQLLPIGQGKAVLINLWATWCTPCLGELGDLAEREQEIRDAGIEVVALAVDRLDGDASNDSEPRKMIRRLEFPFTAGHAPGKLVSYLQNVHDRQMTGSQPLPVPVSFLVDANGRISVIYKGRLKVDDLLADTAHSQGTLTERFARSAPIAGRILPVETVSRQRNQYEARYKHATYLQQAGYTEIAAAENQALIALYPENAGAHNNLGICYIAKNQLALAEASFREAVRIRPDYAKAHANLGTLLTQQGKFPEAASHYQQAINSDPREVTNYQKLGRLLLELGQWAQAQACLQRALQMDPRSADAHTHLGVALAQQGQLPQAAAHLEQALRIQPDHQDAQRNLVKIRQAMGDRN